MMQEQEQEKKRNGKNMGCIIHCPWNVIMGILIEKDSMFLIDEKRMCMLPYDGCGVLKKIIPTPINNRTCI